MARKHRKFTGKVSKLQPRSLGTVQPNAAGIDLGSRDHYVAGPPLPDGSPNVKRFGTTTPELVRLSEWLEQQKTGQQWFRRPSGKCPPD